jgi:hypothetical protein
MATVQVARQHPNSKLSSALSSMLGLCLIVLIAFFAGAGWSRTGLSREVHRDMANVTGSDVKKAENVHIYFLLDRSGSMSSIASDVIGGFNAFVKEQQLASSDESSLTMTLVQFDSQDPHEVIFSGREISMVPLLSKSSFQPRSMTPLYDALGRTIRLAESAQLVGERVVVVTFSDGLENASKEHTQKSVFDQITSKRGLGWTFVFLGANQDSYAEGGGLGFSSTNTQNFAFDGQGTKAACSEVSRATKSMRHKLMQESHSNRRVYDSEDFFEGVKGAEADYSSRLSSAAR